MNATKFKQLLKLATKGKTHFEMRQSSPIRRSPDGMILA
jgi:hypothetical protein